MAIFGTAGIRGNVTSDMTPELAVAVGRAVGRGADGVVAVGRDGRTTGRGLAAAVEAGLLSGGSSVERLGAVPTPALAFASRGRRGVMVTASHNPPTDNGIKCFEDGIEFDRDAERTIERRVAGDDGGAAANRPIAWNDWGDVREASILDDYHAAVLDYVRGYGAPLDGLSIAVDCANGVGALVTPAILRDLGANVATLHGDVDGHFPGRKSKPTAESLADLRRFVADGGAAAGIGHDGDADRLALVDGTGAVVHEDTVLAIVAERYVRERDAADPVVVTTPNASTRIDERVAAAGGRVERVALGAIHEGVARVRARGGTVVFAAEPWKHLHPAFGGWVDGVVSVALLARLIAAAGLDALREPVAERPYRKTNIPCPDGAKAAAMDRIEETLPESFPAAGVDTAHGVRLDRPDGSWLLVRPSGTESYLRLYVEGEGVDGLVATARTVVERAVEAAS